MPKEAAPVALQSEADIKFPLWATTHADEHISVIPSDPNDEHQDIARVDFEAQPSLEIARQMAQLGIGSACEGIVADLQNLGVVDLAKKRVAQKKSVLISTAHLKTTMDAAISHNQLFVASEDEDFAQYNVLLANPMLAWTALRGVNTMPILRKSGRVVRGIPPEGAKKFGISDELVDYVDRRAAPLLTSVFREGNVIHRAPSGTRGKWIRLADGSMALSIQELSPTQARTIRKRTDEVVGMPIDVAGSNSSAIVLKPRHIENDADVHIHMQEMAEAMDSLVEEKVVYGMPEGSSDIEQLAA